MKKAFEDKFLAGIDELNSYKEKNHSMYLDVISDLMYVSNSLKGSSNIVARKTINEMIKHWKGISNDIENHCYKMYTVASKIFDVKKENTKEKYVAIFLELLDELKEGFKTYEHQYNYNKSILV